MEPLNATIEEFAAEGYTHSTRSAALPNDEAQADGGTA
jgi:hypothetical protein